MTRRKVDKNDKPPEVGSVLDDPGELVERTIAEQLGEHPDAMVVLQRQSPQTREWRHLRKYHPQEFDVEAVREEYGGGEFRVRVKNRRGQWLGSARQFGIEGPPIEPAQYVPTAPLGAAAVDRAELLEATRRGGALDDVLGKVLVALISREPPPPPPPIDMVGFAKALQEASDAGAARLAEMVGLKKDLSGGGGGVETFMEALELGMRLGGRQRDDGGFGSVVEALSPVLKRLAENVPAALPSPAASGAQPTPEADMAREPLQAALEVLLHEAAAGSDNPVAWAVVCVEKVPGLLDALERAVSQAGSVDALMSYAEARDPRIKLHADFVREAVEWMLQPDDQPEGDT